jgi:formylglycine-generating enzyme required for sulfatase activity
MVYVPASERQPAFLVDRTEIPVSAFAEFAQTTGAAFSESSPANHAVTGVSFRDARQFAAWAGKQLPTKAQWLRAAFGSADGVGPRYPWGDSPGSDGVQFFGAEIGPVDGCREGASAFSGCINMAGNAWEMLADESVLGVSFRGQFERDVNTDTSMWRAAFLRDPLPTVERWKRSIDPAWMARHQYPALFITEY